MPTTLPSPTDVKEYGALGLLLVLAAYAGWRLLPVLAELIRNRIDFPDKALAAFRQEIQQERQFAASQLHEERQRADKLFSDNNTVIERNTQAVLSLEKTVQALVAKP